MMNNNTLIFGMQYGDEGKGKVVNHFIDYFDSCVRFNGGPNAGHTVIKDNKKYHLHQIPSGIVKNKPVYMEPGMVIDIDKLEKEAEPFDKSLIHISKFVHIITEEHRKADEAGSDIGTTRSGIAYCYSDRALRKGNRVEDIADKLPYTIYDARLFKDKDYLFESAQGIMLDIDYGDYPFCTSSSILPSMRYGIKETIGVMKAYISRVGKGSPKHDTVEELQKLGNEFGVTTGRPRRCFWFDFDLINYVMNIINVDQIAMTKCDIIEKASEIKSYKNGKLVSYKNVGEFIDDVKKHFPVKYLSWTPGNELEKL
jgi:adenylosuccinate synthase